MSKNSLKNSKNDLLFLEKLEINDEKSLPQFQRNELSLLQRLKMIINKDLHPAEDKYYNTTEITNDSRSKFNHGTKEAIKEVNYI